MSMPNGHLLKKYMTLSLFGTAHSILSLTQPNHH